MVAKKKKISTPVPEGLLSKACRVSNLNQTDALIEGLTQLIRSHERQRAFGFRGKIDFDDEGVPVGERVRL